MAIDTRNKRSSTVQFLKWSLTCPPNPDGSLASNADRTHTGHSYAGISTEATAVVAPRRNRGAWHGGYMGPSNLILQCKTSILVNIGIWLFGIPESIRSIQGNAVRLANSLTQCIVTNLGMRLWTMPAESSGFHRNHS
jgi:hypothetical protein